MCALASTPDGRPQARACPLFVAADLALRHAFFPQVFKKDSQEPHHD